MRLRVENRRVKVGEDIEYPDGAFDFAYGGISGDETDIQYLVPVDKDSQIMVMAMEIAAHLTGVYK